MIKKELNKNISKSINKEEKINTRSLKNILDQHNFINLFENWMSKNEKNKFNIFILFLKINELKIKITKNLANYIHKICIYILNNNISYKNISYFLNNKNINIFIHDKFYLNINEVRLIMFFKKMDKNLFKKVFIIINYFLKFELKFIKVFLKYLVLKHEFNFDINHKFFKIHLLKS